jgi:hypothetical protein
VVPVEYKNIFSYYAEEEYYLGKEVAWKVKKLGVLVPLKPG